VWAAVRSSAVFVVIIVLVFTGAGIAAGLHRQPKYTASSELAVIHMNFGGTNALGAFSTAGPILADTYARAVNTAGVIEPLAAKFHTSPGRIASELSATAIAASPIFTVTAQTPSSSGSLALIHAAVPQLMSYVQGVNAANTDAPRLYAELKKAEKTLAAAQNKETAVKASVDDAMAKSNAVSASAAQQAQVSAAQAAVNVATDKETGLRAEYEQSVLNGSDTQYLEPLQSATATKSDRGKKLLLYAFVGLALGIAFATGVAVLRQVWALRKLRTA
jgi:capsular polysaccharide biosynthesis protein